MTPKTFEISCTWSPDWLGYLAIAKAENFEYSRLLKSKEKLLSFIEEAKAAWRRTHDTR